MKELVRATILTTTVTATAATVMYGYKQATTVLDGIVSHTYGSPALQAVSPDFHQIQSEYQAASHQR